MNNQPVFCTYIEFFQDSRSLYYLIREIAYVAFWICIMITYKKHAANLTTKSYYLYALCRSCGNCEQIWTVLLSEDGWVGGGVVGGGTEDSSSYDLSKFVSYEIHSELARHSNYSSPASQLLFPSSFATQLSWHERGRLFGRVLRGDANAIIMSPAALDTENLLLGTCAASDRQKSVANWPVKKWAWIRWI